MSGSKKAFKDILQVPDKKALGVDGAIKLEPYHKTVVVTANTDTDDYDVILPAVAEAAGGHYSIRALLVANDKAATIKTQGDVAGWTDLELGTTGDHVLLYSDGLRWIVVVESITA